MGSCEKQDVCVNYSDYCSLLSNLHLFTQTVVKKVVNVICICSVRISVLCRLLWQELLCTWTERCKLCMKMGATQHSTLYKKVCYIDWHCWSVEAPGMIFNVSWYRKTNDCVWNLEPFWNDLNISWVHHIMSFLSWWCALTIWHNSIVISLIYKYCSLR
jgi:hypothetical protein